MKSKMVTSFKGKKVERKACKYIKGKHYITGDPTIKDSGECYLVEGKYHRFNNDLIEYDYELKRYVLIHKTHLKYGVVGMKDDNPIKGYYSPNLTENVLLYNVETGDETSCISDKVAISLNYRERFTDGKFYPREFKNANFFKKISKAPVNKNSLPYDSRFASDITSEQYDALYKPKFDNKQLNQLGDFLEKNNITFGFEFETSTGYIPDRLCYKYGLIALRDGSIGGLEYVTIPLSGRKGLYALYNICNELRKRTKFDRDCALHLHLGGLNRNMKSLISSFKLGYLMQEEMFTMQPVYKKGNTGVKSKDYCKPLDSNTYSSIKSVTTKASELTEFKKLFKFASDGVDFERYDDDLKHVKSHPSDPNGTRKWQIRSRYKWLNFVPIIFGNKKTLEFRQHTATFNFEKIINFLFMNACFVWLSENSNSDIVNKSSALYKSLVKDANSTISIVTGEVIKKNPSLKDIRERNEEYNKHRKNVMSELSVLKDIEGKYEYKFDKDLDSKFKLSFWGNEPEKD